MPDSVRAFVAIVPPKIIRERMSGMLDGMTLGREARRVPVENVHMTLRFLGQAEPVQIKQMISGLDSLGGRTDPISLRINQITGFPERRPVVVAASTDPDDALSALAEEVEMLAREAEFAPEKRLFKPHITIARFKRPQKRGSVASIETDIPFNASELVLYRSDLSREGARYTAIHTTKLAS